MLNEGYPYITENGNFVLDTIFLSIPDIRNKEIELKNIPGVIEIGLFTKHATYITRPRKTADLMP